MRFKLPVPAVCVRTSSQGNFNLKCRRETVLYCGVSGRERRLCQTLAFIRRNYNEDELIPLPLATLRLVSPGHRGVCQIKVLFLGCPKERTSWMPFGLSDKSGGRPPQ